MRQLHWVRAPGTDGHVPHFPSDFLQISFCLFSMNRLLHRAQETVSPVPCTPTTPNVQLGISAAGRHGLGANNGHENPIRPAFPDRQIHSTQLYSASHSILRSASLIFTLSFTPLLAVSLPPTPPPIVLCPFVTTSSFQTKALRYSCLST